MSLKARGRWYWRRLRSMSAAEILFRVRALIGAGLDRLGWQARPVPAPGPEPGGTAAWVVLPSEDDPAPYHAAAAAVAAGRWPLLGPGPYALGARPDWRRDPRPPAGDGVMPPSDIKYVWELNRHHHWVTLAQAAALAGGGGPALDVLRDQVDSWLAAAGNRVAPIAPNPLETAIRLVNWAVVWQLVGGGAGPLFGGPAGAALRNRLLAAVYRQVRFIRSRYSGHSSANNHLIGEAVGVFVASVTWPLGPALRRWGGEARAVLEREVLCQVSADGVGWEQASAYHRFVLDMLLVAGLAGRAAGQPFPAPYWQRLEAMAAFLAAITARDGDLPAVGDGDDAVLVRFAPDGGTAFDTLAVCALLFKRPDMAAKARRPGPGARWLLGAEVSASWAALAALPPAPRWPLVYPEGGYGVLGRDLEGPQEIRVVFDAGPLGYLSIAAHGHADALALTLAVGGRPVLVDPGTGSYHRSATWRTHFRGTRAHNTVTVDGADQSVAGGPFLWVRKAAARLEVWEDEASGCRAVGSHDGYGRLADPVVHRRDVSLCRRTGRLRVRDILSAQGVHDYAQVWQFAPGFTVERVGAALVATSPSSSGEPVRVALTWPGGAGEAWVGEGLTDPIRGWVSPAYDVRMPAPVVEYRMRSGGETEIVCDIVIGDSFTTQDPWSR